MGSPARQMSRRQAQRKLTPEEVQIAEQMQKAQIDEAQSRMQQQLLRQTLTDPVASRRAHVSLPVVAWEGSTPLILVALPTGERWEIPLSDRAREVIAHDLAEGPPSDEQVEQIETRRESGLTVIGG